MRIKTEIDSTITLLVGDGQNRNHHQQLQKEAKQRRISVFKRAMTLSANKEHKGNGRSLHATALHPHTISFTSSYT
ncbi:hypothetical protein E2C01_037569 [Portunus trituberculatus]|uniref:Uncharacterized protein n=1 Tax=Portunus trituberculatus TaxID=210409 RepID=A0A5B7FHF2_PORTR|nr:hypothetical protein [Portunus trituberculatus]